MKLLSCVALEIPLFSSAALAQSSLPAGTILPVRLNSALKSEEAKPGQQITARVMQDVPLPSGKEIEAGSKVIGQIISVRQGQNGAPSEISVRFDRIQMGHYSIPVTTDLRAIASWMDVEDAQTPAITLDRSTPWAWATHTLIGGEVSYGQGSPVADGTQVVGTALANGVLVAPRANCQAGCRGETDGNSIPQALWVFSSNACGVYGIQNLRIVHAGRTNPQGEIVLASDRGHLLVRAGAGVLLRVISSGQR